MHKVMLSAGEASGDAHGASALQALKRLEVEVECFGMGAGKLQHAGMELLVDCRNLSVMGITDVLAKLPLYLWKARQLKLQLQQRQPDLLILIDYAEFNLYLAKAARQLDIPVLFYISPKIWASRPERIHTIAERVSHMAVLFPFEVPLYQQAGVPVTYVGNPLLEQITVNEDQTLIRNSLGLQKESTVVAIIPGSRRGEIRYILPVLLQAALLLQARNPDIQFILPKAPTVDADLLQRYLSDSPELDVRVLDGNAHEAMRACDAAMIASGTATLEAAVIGAPMVVVYIVHWLNYLWMKHKTVIENFSLVNIVAGKRVAIELIQEAATAEAVADETWRLLNDRKYAQSMREELGQVKSEMGQHGASENLAKIARSLLKKL